MDRGRGDRRGCAGHSLAGAPRSDCAQRRGTARGAARAAAAWPHRPLGMGFNEQRLALGRKRNVADSSGVHVDVQGEQAIVSASEGPSRQAYESKSIVRTSPRLSPSHRFRHGAGRRICRSRAPRRDDTRRREWFEVIACSAGRLRRVGDEIPQASTRQFWRLERARSFYCCPRRPRPVSKICVSLLAIMRRPMLRFTPPPKPAT